MLSYEKTIEVLNKFYNDCLRFWERENDLDPQANAKKDIERVTTNPFEPQGKELHPLAKQHFMQSI